jgi:hypothetical protein
MVNPPNGGGCVEGVRHVRRVARVNHTSCFRIPQLLPLWFRIPTPMLPETHHNTMPGWPTAEGKRCITIELANEHVEHLDVQSQYEGCSRAAYLRRLIVRDIERQGLGRVATA